MKPSLLANTWQSYAPTGRVDAIKKLLVGKDVQTDGPVLPEKIQGKDIDIQKNIKALNDPTYASMNQGEISLIKRSSKQSDASKPNEDMHQKDQERKLRLKQVKRSRPKKQHEEKEVVSSTIGKKARPEERQVEPQTTVSQLPVETIEQHTQRNNQNSLFTTRLSDMNRVSSEVLVSHPPSEEILAYAIKIESQRPAYVGMQKFVSESAGMYNYPDVPVLSRKAILPFYREAHPQRRWERPCLNLDRNPYPHEGKTRCMSHIISAEKLGEQNAFRCREMLIGDVNIRIEEAIKQGTDPSIHLSPAPGYCVFCHMNIVLQDSISQQYQIKNRSEVKRQEELYGNIDDDDDENIDDENIVIVNPYLVIIDKPGEYNRNVLLLSDKVKAGIWGPFILLNPDNYIATLNIPGSDRLRGFQERAEMHFFRPTRVSSPRRESQQRTFSTQLAHTGATFGNTNSLN